MTCQLQYRHRVYVVTTHCLLWWSSCGEWPDGDVTESAGTWRSLCTLKCTRRRVREGFLEGTHSDLGGSGIIPWRRWEFKLLILSSYDLGYKKPFCAFGYGYLALTTECPSTSLQRYTLLFWQSVLSLSGVTSLTPWSIQRTLIGICDEIHKAHLFRAPRFLPHPFCILRPTGNSTAVRVCHEHLPEGCGRRQVVKVRWCVAQLTLGLLTNWALSNLNYKEGTLVSSWE